MPKRPSSINCSIAASNNAVEGVDEEVCDIVDAGVNDDDIKEDEIVNDEGINVDGEGEEKEEEEDDEELDNTGGSIRFNKKFDSSALLLSICSSLASSVVTDSSITGNARLNSSDVKSRLRYSELIESGK